MADAGVVFEAKVLEDAVDAALVDVVFFFDVFMVCAVSEMVVDPCECFPAVFH